MNKEEIIIDILGEYINWEKDRWDGKLKGCAMRDGGEKVHRRGVAVAILQALDQPQEEYKWDLPKLKKLAQKILQDELPQEEIEEIGDKDEFGCDYDFVHNERMFQEKIDEIIRKIN